MSTPIVGHTYRITFENSPEGETACEGCPLEVESVCEDSRPDYLVFETPLPTGSEGFEFFLDAGEWWDENRWTRLVSIVPVELSSSVEEPAR